MKVRLLQFHAALVTLLAINSVGCVRREIQTWRVVTDGDFRPVVGAKVIVQPWAPIHPFWPGGGSGTTDARGEVRLPLPQDFGFTAVFVKGYSVDKQPEHYTDVPPGVCYDIYVKR